MNPIHQIASDVATSAYGIYKTGDAKKIKLPNSPVEKILKQPNPQPAITEYVLFYITQVYLLLPSGEAFWIKERNGLGKVTELWPVPPNWVNEIPSKTYPYFKIYPQGNMQAGFIEVPPDDMIYFKKPDITNPYLRGVGRAEGIGDEIETDEYMAKYQKRYFFNDAIPPMVGMMPGADEPTVNRTEELWQQKYGGLNNKHKMAWLNWDAKFELLKETYKDMDFIESRKYLRDVSNQHWSIPPELFGILENSNRSTIDAAYYLYTKNVLRKELKFIDDTLNRQLLPEFDSGTYLEHDNVVPEDEEFLLKKSSEGLKGGALSVNQWLRTNGFEEIGEKGEVVYIPINMVPMSLTGEPLPTNLPPAQPLAEPPPKEGKKKALTPEHKQQFWKIFDKAAVKNERSFISALKKYFQAQQDRINKALEKSIKAATDEPDGLLAWATEDDLLYKTLTPLWTESMKEGFTQANTIFGYGLTDDMMQPKFLEWIKANGLDRAKGINSTTKDKLRTTLSEGIASGEGIPKLRDRVSQVYADAKGYRSTLISRTETITTVNAGALDTYKVANVQKKEWLATMDSRVREAHAAMNGEVVGIDEAFSNGSMYPDEPNCRCTILPVLPE
jgi:HK97 family phage portal protein